MLGVVLMTFAQVVRGLLAAKGMTQSDLARAIGRHRQYVSSLLNGHIKDPSLEVAADVADALGTDLGTIVKMMKDGE